MDRVAGLLLAAGGGRRVGGPKALFRLGEELLVERAVRVLRDAGCSPVVVVLGAGAEQVQAEADLGGAEVVFNPAWGTGIGSSLRAGLAALADTPAVATVIMLVDTPGVTPEAVRRVAALPYPQALVCATYGGRRGHPMLLGRGHWSGIATLAKLDVGARPYLMAHASEVLDVRCDGLSSDEDIDTPAAAAAWGLTPPANAVPPMGADPAQPADPARPDSAARRDDPAQPGGAAQPGDPARAENAAQPEDPAPADDAAPPEGAAQPDGAAPPDDPALPDDPAQAEAEPATR